MLKASVDITGGAEAQARFAAAKMSIRRVMIQTASEGGEQMRTYLVREFRTVRSATSTGRISGNLAASYGHDDPRPEGNDVVMGFGLLRTTARAMALIYGPVHEFGATIKARFKPLLKFRLSDGTWRSKKSVRIPARPGIEPTVKVYAPVLERLLADRIEDVV